LPSPLRLCAGEPKRLVLRYAVPNVNPELTRRGEIVLDELEEGKLPRTLNLSSTIERLPKVWILRACYGHPKSTSSVIIMSYIMLERDNYMHQSADTTFIHIYIYIHA
jgi:hypothetical protein